MSKIDGDTRVYLRATDTAHGGWQVVCITPGTNGGVTVSVEGKWISMDVMDWSRVLKAIEAVAESER